MTSARPIRTPLRQRFKDFRREGLPFLIWGLALAGAVFLLFQRGASHEFIGLAQAREFEVSTPTPGMLESLEVDRFEPVEVGQILARLDGRDIAAALATAEEEILHLQAQLTAQRLQLEEGHAAAAESWVTELRRFQIDESQLWLDLLNTRVDLETEKVNAERLKASRDRLRELVKVDVAAAANLEESSFLLEQSQERVVHLKTLVEEQRLKWLAAEERRESFAAANPAIRDLDPQLAPLRQALQVQTSRIEALSLQGRHLVLRAPTSGRVAEVLARPGQAVLAGEPVLRLSSTVIDQIALYLPEGQEDRLQIEDRVALQRISEPGQIGESVVVSLGPKVETLPPRLWRDPNTPEYGRPVQIAPVPALGLVPGEKMLIRILN
ncbi:MAG: biotin/lipoyl-binding protein [Planctomycetota bacterium]|nr:MAG: biotin/lipoyl-binding protein [Planctomycetota bacterium]